MSRVADFTIKGFLYQFNKTLLEILKSQNDSLITVEGIVEDVEVAAMGAMTAIQCKYHEATAFTPSSIFRPVLQMMDHFHANPEANVRYILFAHYPSMKEAPQPSVLKTYLQNALDSKKKDLGKLAAVLRGKVNLDGFLARFTLEPGPKFEDLVAQVCAAFKENGIPEGDIDTLAYPNAVNMIAELSVKHDPTKRQTTNKTFIERLKSIRKTAISRWTMALRTRKQLLDARRKQLKTHLDTNSRRRYFVIDSKRLEDYQEEFVLFVKDYLDKYHFKPAHIFTPIFCLSATREGFDAIRLRLFRMHIVSADGYVGGTFDEPHFFREPICKGRREIKREFSLRLLRWEDHSQLLNKGKCDDLFVIGDPDLGSLNTADVNVEHLPTTSLKEIKYVMGVSNVYE
ncbi:MAG: hypothetical protein ACLPLR_11310 [Terriglobales bacterium]